MRKLLMILFVACGAAMADDYYDDQDRRGVPESLVFVRGDTDGDGQVCMADSVRLLYSFFFPERIEILCPDAADANDDGVLDLSDVLSGLLWTFQGVPLPPPHGSPGVDPTEDDFCHCAYDAAAYFGTN